MASERLKVLIVGAGLGGLTLGVLLEQAGIPFTILEKHSGELIPLGSSISLNQAIQPLFEQLGMLSELEAISKPLSTMTFLKENMSKIGSLDLQSDSVRIMDRPSLYRLLLSRISPDNIVTGKRVNDIEQNQDGVLVRCSDNSVFTADILVGADGAYSCVRRCLYRDLRTTKQLPKSDMAPLAFDHHCLVDLTRDTCDMMVVIGKDKPYSWWLIPLKGNRIAWRVTYNLPTTQIRQEHHIRSSDWGPDQVQEMADACRDFACPYGGTLADLIDKTPKDRMSKVLLEEKGAAQAMLDAVSLANLLYEIPSTSPKDIQATFEAYYKERVAFGKAAVQGSRTMGRLSGGHKWTESLVRSMFLNVIPNKVQQSILDKMLSHRPQAIFLPFVEDRGEFKAKAQTPSNRMRDLSGLCVHKFVHHPCAVLYQVDLPFPGYDRDAPTFHWKYDAVVETLINNNPPSSRRSKPASGGSQGTKAGASPATTEPKIGHHLLTRAQRKDIKKVHVPQGVVMQYEGELVSFLDQLTLSTNDDDKDDCKSDFCLSESVVVVSNDSTHEIDASNWVLVQPSDVNDLPSSSSSSPATTTIATEASVDTTVASSEKDSLALDDSDEQPQIFLRWDIQDQFLRFVAHALCAFYGLVSFSKTALDGKRHLYICHPTHLESIGKLASPETSTTRPKPLRRQRTLEHVQELPLQELEQLWKKVEPVKLADCPRPDMTFFEYLYPSTQPVF
ncbi:hypothetical protein BGX34_002867 [Mortierella sp. NVP85]|nr:hypothetical protein BGX34_002867 [Mortierella sp. NVP85]